MSDTTQPHDDGAMGVDPDFAAGDATLPGAANDPAEQWPSDGSTPDHAEDTAEQWSGSAPPPVGTQQDTPDQWSDETPTED